MKSQIFKQFYIRDMIMSNKSCFLPVLPVSSKADTYFTSLDWAKAFDLLTDVHFYPILFI